MTAPTLSSALRDLESRIATIDAVLRSAERAAAADPLDARRVQIMRRTLARIRESLEDPS